MRVRRRSLLVLPASAAVLGPLAATAAQAKDRTLTFEYTGFGTAGASGAD